MDITNNIPARDIDSVASQIYQLILHEPQLTKRSLTYIKDLILKNGFYVAVDKRKVQGFIAKEQLAGNYYELKCWYVVSSHRDTGLSLNIFKKAIENKKHRYIGVTFQQQVAKKLEPLHFKVIPLTKLPVKVFFRYITTRQLKSILKHSFKTKSLLLMRE